MKITKVLGALLAVITLGTAITLTPDVSAQAKAKYSLKTIPKKFRGTRYSYYKDPQTSKASYSKLVISAKKFTTSYSNHPDMTSVFKVKSLNLSRNITNHDMMRSNDWQAVYVKKGTLYQFDWESYSANKKSLSSRYKFVSKTRQGKRAKVLREGDTTGRGANKVFQTTYWYSTKAQAKYFNPTGK